MSNQFNVYLYKAEVIKIVDGDTFKADIDLGFGVWIKDKSVRLYGVNTPESRTTNLEEKKMGLAAKEFTDQWIKKANDKVKIDILDKNDKFGRILARVWNEAGECLNTEIVKAGLAREYFGVGDKTFEEFKKA
jgi:micrococcal nuclease